jgi:predicted DsbA family dithiol-disulfide isomerase
LQRSLQDWQGQAVQVEYRAFFLNPGIPPEGYDFIPYMEAKFNGRVSLAQAFEGPRRMGEAAGLVFNMDKISKAPNSILSHCLIAIAPADIREQVIEAVYAAYFEHGQDIGDIETLIQIGEKFGMDEDRLRVDLSAGTTRAQVEAEAREAGRLGVSGVPFFVINDKYAFSGAQQPDVILNTLRRVAKLERGEQS